MMVARRSDGRLCHARARDLPDFLNPGDVVVVNTSATIPAALLARRTDGLELDLHLSTPLPGGPEGHWVVELRHGARRFRAARAGESLSLPAMSVLQARSEILPSHDESMVVAAEEGSTSICYR